MMVDTQRLVDCWLHDKNIFILIVHEKTFLAIISRQKRKKDKLEKMSQTFWESRVKKGSV